MPRLCSHSRCCDSLSGDRDVQIEQGSAPSLSRERRQVAHYMLGEFASSHFTFRFDFWDKEPAETVRVSFDVASYLSYGRLFLDVRVLGVSLLRGLGTTVGTQTWTLLQQFI